MKQLTYHIGLCVRAFPSDRQKQIIRKNAGVNRFVYNRLVGVNREMYELEKTAPYSQTDRDRLTYLKSAYGTTTDMRNVIPILNDPDIDNYSIANAKRDYQKAWNQYRKVSTTGVPAFKKRSNSYTYGTNCHHDPSLSSDIVGLFEGSVRFLDKGHFITVDYILHQSSERIRKNKVTSETGRNAKIIPSFHVNHTVMNWFPWYTYKQ